MKNKLLHGQKAQALDKRELCVPRERSVMLLTIIVFYSFIVRCLKRENKLIGTTGKQTSFDSATNSISSYSITNSSTSSIAYNHLSKNHHHHHRKESVSAINRPDKIDQLQSLATATEQGEEEKTKEEENLNEDSGREPFSEDDEVADDNQFDEEEFYNIIATKAAAFQSKRNSSTSTVSSGSMYDDTYRTKRHSLRSQSSTCSDIMETSVISNNTTRRSSEESCRLQNRKLNYKSRRHGFTTLSKRRRTTGRYFSVFTSTKIKFSPSLDTKFEIIRFPLCTSRYLAPLDVYFFIFVCSFATLLPLWVHCAVFYCVDLIYLHIA